LAERNEELKDAGCSGSEDFATRSDGELYSDSAQRLYTYP
jgi:hypothetical protein